MTSTRSQTHACRKWLAFFTVTVLCGFAGCSKGNLPLHFEVETAIQKRTSFLTPHKVILPKVVRLKFGHLDIKDSYEDADYAYWIPTAVVFKSAGLVNIEVKTAGYILVDDITHTINIDLTMDGKVLASSWEKDPHADQENTSRRFVEGYTVPIANRKIVEVKRITRLENGDARAEFTWRWEPTLSGKAFDVNDAAYQALSPVARQCVDKSSDAKIDSSKIESAIAIFRLENKEWRFLEFASPLQ
jgi:hypothetical protein